jgi:hypothetical protein
MGEGGGNRNERPKNDGEKNSKTIGEISNQL